MLSNFFNLLAISVSELDPIVTDAPENHTKEIVIIVLLAAAAIAVILIWAKLDVSEKLRERKKERAREKAENLRNAELERLHEIKRKNQRK